MARQASDPRPAFYALQLTVEMLEGFTAVTQLDLGAGVWAYQFERPQGPVWVMWYEVGGLTFPEAPAATMSVMLPFAAAQAEVRRAPTAGATEAGQDAGQDAGHPAGQIVASQGGTLTLTVDSTPVFVTEAP